MKRKRYSEEQIIGILKQHEGGAEEWRTTYKGLMTARY